LVVTAGKACCRGEGRASATVKILDQPTLTILPPASPVVVCQDAQEGFVDVEFTVVSDTPDPISVPNGHALCQWCHRMHKTRRRRCW
jgi:hypothetical protein